MADGRLLRVFGVAFGVAVAVGNTIGGGILRTPGQIAEYLPTPGLFMAVWVVGGIYALLGALSLAELGAAIPKSGGQTVFVRRALGAYPGFVVGWSDWISTCASTAFVAMVIGEYTQLMVPRFGQTVVAIAAALAFALLHLRGVKLAGRTQVITSALKALAFLALIAACFAIGQPESSVFEQYYVHRGSFWAGVSAFVLSLQAVIYTYDGWTGPIYFSEEVREPGRDIPRAMLGGVLSVMAIYLLINAAFLYVLPVYEMAGDPLVAARAANTIFGDTGELVIRVLTIVSMLSAINALTLMAPRVLYAIPELPAAASVDQKGTPTVALASSTLVVVLLIATGTLTQVGALAAFFFVANYTLSFLSVFVLRRKEPELPRPYRAWGFPLTTGLALAGSIVFLVAAVFADTSNALISLGLLALSAPAFHLLRR